MTAGWPPALWPHFVFLRHGTSTANAAGLVAGSDDAPLTDAGRDEARRAAGLLAPLALARVVTSTLSRAIETAEIATAGRGLPVARSAALNERHWGPYEGGPTDARPSALDPAGVEAWSGFRARVLAGLRAIDGSGPVLVVGHRGLARVLAEVLEADAEAALQNAVPCRIDLAGRRIAPLVAETSHRMVNRSSATG